MFEQLLKRHSLPRVDSRYQRDIEHQTVRIKTKKPAGEIGPRTPDPALPFKVSRTQAAALDSVVLMGNEGAAAQSLGIARESVNERLKCAFRRIPGPHRLAKLIAWARARNLHTERGE